MMAQLLVAYVYLRFKFTITLSNRNHTFSLTKICLKVSHYVNNLLASRSRDYKLLVCATAISKTVVLRCIYRCSYIHWLITTINEHLKHIFFQRFLLINISMDFTRRYLFHFAKIKQWHWEKHLVIISIYRLQSFFPLFLCWIYSTKVQILICLVHMGAHEFLSGRKNLPRLTLIRLVLVARLSCVYI